MLCVDGGLGSGPLLLLCVAGEEDAVGALVGRAGGAAAGLWVGGRGAALKLAKVFGGLLSSGAGGGCGMGRSRLMVPTTEMIVTLVPLGHLGCRGRNLQSQN